MRILIGALLLTLALAATGQNIEWWFDTHDSSFGQSAAGDIDGDGKDELVFGCYRNDSCIYALNAEDGTLLWKFNAHAPGAEGCNDVAVLLYDTDGDDTLDVIVPSSCNPITFCFEGKNGSVKWATPTRGSDSPPVAVDIDGDGTTEIIHGEFGGYVICINAEDGTVQWELAVDLNSWIQTAPTIADLNQDGKPDFVVATWNTHSSDTNKVYAYRGDNRQLLWTFPLDDVSYHGTAVADLDDDGLPELVIGDYSGKLHVLNGENGSEAWNYSYGSYFYAGAPASIADMNGDGHCEILMSAWYKIIALSHNGTPLWNYSIPGFESCFRGAALCDIDNDGMPDPVFATSGGRLIGLKGTNGNIILNIDLANHYGDTLDFDHAPVIADFDGDGEREAWVVGGFTKYPDFHANYGRGYCVELPAGNGPDWKMFQNNTYRNSSLCDSTPLAINNIGLEPENLRFYPNPAGDYVHITLPASLNGIPKIRIYNTSLTEFSHPVYSAISGNVIVLQCENFPNGMYLIQIQNESVVMKGVFVKISQ